MSEREQRTRSQNPEVAPTDHTLFVDAPATIGVFRLDKLLGRGGMGEVWQAHDRNLERDVALKLMRRELTENEEAVKRFMREARAVARLNHPNIVQIHTFGELEGVLYFVMELVEGETVSQKVRREAKLSLEVAASIVLQAIEGLDYAYARGIVHRDIKPSNLMVRPDGLVKIADFGLAKMVEADTQMTAAGSTMGSPNYMSPEQARGEEADHRSDMYSLGIAFYQMMTGTLPFTADSPLSVLLKQIQEPLPEPLFLRELLDGRVLDVVKRMTLKNAAYRYQSYAELAQAVSSLVPGAVAHVRSAGTATASLAAATPQPDQLLGTMQTRSGLPLISDTGPATFPATPSPDNAAADPSLASLSSLFGPEDSPTAAPTAMPVSGTSKPSALPPPRPSASSAPPPGPQASSLSSPAIIVMALGVLALASGAWFGYDAYRRSTDSSAAAPKIAAPAVTPSPTATPVVVSETPATTPAPTVAPTPNERIVVVPVVVNNTPAPTPSPRTASNPPDDGGLPLLVPTPFPATTPRSSITRIGSAVVGHNLPPGSAVNVAGEQGAPMTIPAGSEVRVLQAISLPNNQSAYLVDYQGKKAVVALSLIKVSMQADSELADGTTPTPAATPIVPSTGAKSITLGAPRDTAATVMTFRDASGLVPHKALPRGTKLPVMKADKTTYMVRLPDGRDVYVLRGTATEIP